MTLPDGYEAQTSVGFEGFARTGSSEWLKSVLSEGRRLHEWASASDRVATGLGRGPVYVVPAPVAGSGDSADWAIRHYRRGGAMADAFGDRYLRLGETRPVRELKASVAARARGVRTPAVVAGAVYGKALFYRADLVTELVPNALTLAEEIFGNGSSTDPLGSLALAGRLVRSLELARVLHADLNAHNVLLGGNGEERTAHVIDLDRSRVLPLSARLPRAAMRRRLERSMQKLALEHARPLSRPEWDALRAGFGEPA